MPISVVVEFQARPGARAQLADALARLSEEYAPRLPGFLGSAMYEVIDNPDGLVEIAEWDSADAQRAAVEEAMAAGVYEPLLSLVAAPFRVTRISPA